MNLSKLFPHVVLTMVLAAMAERGVIAQAAGGTSKRALKEMIAGAKTAAAEALAALAKEHEAMAASIK